MPMPLLVGRVQAGKVLLVDGLGTSQALSVKAGGIFLSISTSGLAGGSSSSQHWLGGLQDPLPSREFQNLLFQCRLQCIVCLRDVGRASGLGTALFFFLGEDYAPKDFFIHKGEIPPHLPL